MSGLVTRAQLELLAKLLEVDVERVHRLERLGADGLKQLRTAISHYLFDGEAEMFSRVSKLAPLMPDALVVKVAHAAVPPLVSGRIGGALGLDHKERAAGLLRKMRADYLADAAGYLDPRAVAAMAPEFEEEPDALIPPAQVLLARKDYATAAGFLEHATPALIRAFAEGLDDLRSLIEAVAFVDDDDRLSFVIEHVPRDRLAAIMGSALDDEKAVLAALSVAARVTPELSARIGRCLLIDTDDGQLANLIRVAADNDALPELAIVLARTGEPALGRVESNGLAADQVANLRSAAKEAEQWQN